MVMESYFPNFGLSPHLGFRLRDHGSLYAFLHDREHPVTGPRLRDDMSKDWKHILVICPQYSFC